MGEDEGGGGELPAHSVLNQKKKEKLGRWHGIGHARGSAGRRERERSD